jgi:hypothetical protein
MSHPTFIWITALASLGAFACSAGDSGGSGSTGLEENALTSAGQDLRAAAPSYVTLRRDLRRCASPLCGGFFAAAVNQDTLRCADGSRSAECYVADLDLSALGLSEEQQATLQNEASSLLLLGQIRSIRTVAGRLGELAVSEAWRGHPGVTPSGRFFRARNDGIVCITSPCLSFSAELLNRQEPSVKLAEIDLSAVSNDPSAAFEQLNADDGLLLAGRRTTVTGPAGSARGLRASEFYLPFVAQPQSCGSRRSVDCGEGNFCNFPVAAVCGSFDAPGVCEPIPDACFELFAPVCGCDGETYSNSCFAASAGVSVFAPGECQPPAPQACGSRGLPQCDDGSFCSFPAEANCGRADAPGTCTVRSQICPFIFKPVCGCDGQTYSNSCSASSAGVSVEHEGACGAAAP